MISLKGSPDSRDFAVKDWYYENRIETCRPIVEYKGLDCFLCAFRYAVEEENDYTRYLVFITDDDYIDELKKGRATVKEVFDKRPSYYSTVNIYTMKGPHLIENMKVSSENIPQEYLPKEY